MGDNLLLPTPQIRARKLDLEVEQQALAGGLDPLLAKIIAARPRPVNFDLQQLLVPKLSLLDHPQSMQDMAKASARVAEAIINREVIGLETDHDCDGQTSHAVLFYNLVHKFGHPTNLIRSYIGHRLTEGYGLSTAVAQRILADKPKPALIITADNGSSDEERIALLASENIAVIVTDHHQLPISGPPQSAYACLNPTRKDCDYPDPYIAGCMVAWLLMAATRQELIQRGYLSKDAPKITDSLDFVAVGTVADCVSMARSNNNRAVVNHGLKLINAGIKPCWRAVKTLANGEQLSVEDLGFKVGPLLNSDGRLASAFGSVSFLLAEDDLEAQRWVYHLQDQNKTRKAIQQKITSQGLQIAMQQAQSGNYSLCIFLSDGHSGVHGISASRIKDSFGRPTVFLAPKFSEPEILTGSIRGIEGFHVGKALQWIMQQNPGLLLAAGGHAGAGGVTLQAINYSKFAAQFELSVQQQLTTEHLGPVIWTDGELPLGLDNMQIINTLAQLEPYGREFEVPIFEVTGILANLRKIGDGTHARIELKVAEQHFYGVWFNFNTTAIVGDNVHCAFTLKISNFGKIKHSEIQVAWLYKV